MLYFFAFVILYSGLIYYLFAYPRDKKTPETKYFETEVPHTSPVPPNYPALMSISEQLEKDMVSPAPQWRLMDAAFEAGEKKSKKKKFKKFKKKKKSKKKLKK